MNREQLKMQTPPNLRSEVLAKFDHQQEANDLATLEFTEEELHRALEDVNSPALAEWLETCGYRKDTIIPRVHDGILPGHIRAELDRVMYAPQPDDKVKEAAKARRDQRLEYLRKRYGVEPVIEC